MYNLTEKEQSFITEFLRNNGCGANTPQDLLADNFSCQSIEDLREVTGFTNHEIAGLISSLENKSVIWIEERDGAICKSNSRVAQMNFEPDLYWVSEEYLESLPLNEAF
jgi:hypothetical protein